MHITKKNIKIEFVYFFVVWLASCLAIHVFPTGMRGMVEYLLLIRECRGLCPRYSDWKAIIQREEHVSLMCKYFNYLFSPLLERLTDFAKEEDVCIPKT